VGVYLLKIEVHTASLEEPSCRRPRGPWFAESEREREKNKCIEPVYQAYQKAQNHMTLSMLVMAFFSVSGSETGIDWTSTAWNG
jgi:hypothetical protein